MELSEKKIMRRILSFAIVACAIVFNNVECLNNTGRLFDCWPIKIKFQEFPLDFYFSSRNHTYQQLKYGSVVGKDIDFDPNRRTTAVVHGMGGSSHEFNVKALVHHLLLWKDMNVVVLDWRRGAENILFYPQAVANTEYAAIALSQLFIRLSQISGIPPKDWKPVHFIGHSLGAHVVGQAAEMLKNVNLTIGRVTGLDPAEPCFVDANSPLRLKSSSAKFVDVIHTDGATVKNERFGLLDQLGHVDFYVNGGSVQPGCNNIVRHKRNLDIEKIITHVTANGSCHHNRAFTLFIESVIQARTKTCKFWAHPWKLGTSKAKTSRILKQKCNKKKCVEMGINAELYDHSKATYYVETTGGPPYCNNLK